MAGLLVAILVKLAHSVLISRVNRLAREFEKITSALLEVRRKVAALSDPVSQGTDLAVASPQSPLASEETAPR